VHSRKVSGSDPAPALSGQISRVSIADLLSTLEGRGRDAIVRFSTPVGPASVWFANGRLIDAEMGVLTGEPALYRIFGLTQGTFEVSSEHAERPRVIQDPVSVLVARRSKRAARWEDLVFGGPALDGIPTRVTTTPPEPSEPEDRKLLRLIDGRRTLLEILDESRLDPVQAFEVLGRLQQDGHFSIERSSSSRPPPPRPQPSAMREARRSSPGRLSPETTPPRTSTLMGLSAQTEVPPSDGHPPLDSLSPSKRQSVATLIGPVDPGWLEPPSHRPSSNPPEAGRSSVESAPDESGLKETQLRLERERSDARNGRRPPSDWPKVEVSPSIPPESSAAAENWARQSSPPSLPPASSGLAVPGAVVGPYQILFRLAQGPSSLVYLCREAEHGSVRSLFALKIFRARPEFVGALERFNTAAAQAERLTHPNITPVLGTGTLDGQPLIVSEYVDGCSFAALLKRYSAARPIPYVLAVLFDAMRGLQAAHELGGTTGAPLGLVHGNLCPRDLILGLDGSCRVTDLGASLALRAVGAITQDSSKLSYSSPERQLGRALDARSDVFSLGAILYNALTGVEPFGAPVSGGVRSSILERRAEPPSGVGLRPPKVFDAVCLRALEPDPERRFQSMREFLLALEEAALEHDTLASLTEVAGWIAAAFGRELELRRLSVLDASRRSRGRSSASVPPPVVSVSPEHAPPSLPVPPGAILTKRSSDVPSAAPIALVPRVPTAALVPRFPELETAEFTPRRRTPAVWLFALLVILGGAGALAWFVRENTVASRPPAEAPATPARPTTPPEQPSRVESPARPPAGESPAPIDSAPLTGAESGSDATPPTDTVGAGVEPAVKRRGAPPRGRRPVVTPPPQTAEDPAPSPANETEPRERPAEEEAPGDPVTSPAPAPPTATSDSEFRYGI
jgi:hypothetical protein